jgi:hypothetical protein
MGKLENPRRFRGHCANAFSASLALVHFDLLKCLPHGEFRVYLQLMSSPSNFEYERSQPPILRVDLEVRELKRTSLLCR